MTDDREYTPAGDRIYRHEAQDRPLELAVGHEDSIQAISDHVERHIGPIDGVFHELISDVVHIDVHYVKPGPDRPFHELVGDETKTISFFNLFPLYQEEVDLKLGKGTDALLDRIERRGVGEVIDPRRPNVVRHNIWNLFGMGRS